MSNTAVEAQSSILLEENVEKIERIECVGFCHNGPIDDSAKAIKYAADHDPDAAAEFLLIHPCCDKQLPLCAKKVDALLLSIILGSKFVKCTPCNKRVPSENLIFLPLNHR